ncbi:MAG TPA: hypothetical protein VIC57_00100 [Candidatus Dormibacteraeota bacterium]
MEGVILLNALDRPHDAVAPLQRYLLVDPTGGCRDEAQRLPRAAGG